MRLIDANVLIEEFKKWLPKEGSEWLQCDIHPLENLSVSAILTIEEQPTVEAVSVVRCKNCKYFIDGHPNVLNADGLCENADVLVDLEDFCSYGVDMREKV